MGVAPIRNHESIARRRNAPSPRDPSSLFTRDGGDVRGVDSLMSPHDCGQERTQRCCAVKWSTAHAEAIETGNGGRRGVTASKFSNLRILYSPQFLAHPGLCHKHTQADTEPTTPPGPLSSGGESVISTNLFPPPPLPQESHQHRP